VTDDAKNFMHYSNTEYDDVFNTAYTTVDDDVKVENYKKAQMILAEDAAAVYIEDPANLVAVSKKFGGYLLPDGSRGYVPVISGRAVKYTVTIQQIPAATTFSHGTFGSKSA